MKRKLSAATMTSAFVDPSALPTFRVSSSARSFRFVTMASASA
jgi:hypothetical protein